MPLSEQIGYATPKLGVRCGILDDSTARKLLAIYDEIKCLDRSPADWRYRAHEAEAVDLHHQITQLIDGTQSGHIDDRSRGDQHR
jgi:hypothetical protein